MFRRFHPKALVVISFAGTLLEAAPALAAWESDVSYGGSMPTDFYVPDSPAASPPVVVSLHYCGGNKGNAHSWFESYANMYGFVIITPQAGGDCFDASPGRSGERAEIVKMVDYAAMQYDADTNRVFAAGASSGACMTQALLAAYPEVFAAGSSLAGVPAGAWTGGNAYGWSTPMQSAEQWGDVVRQVNPSFSGPWPRIQLWHGQGDTTLTYSQNWPAEVAQWTNVWGLTDADGTTEMIQPMGATDTWERTSYEDGSGTVGVEANSAGGGVPHDLTGRGLWSDVVRFFGLDMPADSTTGSGGAGGSTSGSAGAGGSATTTAGTAGSDGGGGMQGGTTGTTTASMGGNSSGVGGASGTPTGSATTGTVADSGTTTTGMATVGSTATSTAAGGGQTSGGTGVGGMPALGGASDAMGDEGGCGCRTLSSTRSGHSPLAVLGLGLLGWLFRRQRAWVARG